MTREPPEPPDFMQTATRLGLALIPGVGGAAQVIYDDVRANLAHRQWQTMQEIADDVGEDLLDDRLRDDTVLQALLVAAIETATRTGIESKRRLLAKTAAAAILDPAKVDEGQLRVEAFRDLDGPHIRALERMRQLTVDHPGWPTFQTGSEAWGRYRQELVAIWFAEPAPVRAALLRCGVAVEPSMTLMASYHPEGINDFGQSLLSELRAIDETATAVERGPGQPE